jgi:3',5'-cyclic AMP phosphodiesterase CpdA
MTHYRADKSRNLWTAVVGLSLASVFCLKSAFKSRVGALRKGNTTALLLYVVFVLAAGCTSIPQRPSNLVPSNAKAAAGYETSTSVRVDSTNPATVKIGWITDIHQGAWHSYAEAMTEAIDFMTPWAPDLLIASGDMVDDASKPEYNDYINGRGGVSDCYQIESTPRVLIAGNHDFYHFSLSEMLTMWPNDAKIFFNEGLMYGSADVAGIHVVTLDAQYKTKRSHTHIDAGTNTWPEYSAGYINQAQLDWLAADLAATLFPTIVIHHQCLGTPGTDGESSRIYNRQDVMDILSSSGKVIAAFNGHDHHYQYALVDGVNYFTMLPLSDDSRGQGFLENDSGAHAQITIDKAAETITVDVYENDSKKGYLLGNSTTVTYSTLAPP